MLPKRHPGSRSWLPIYLLIFLAVAALAVSTRLGNLSTLGEKYALDNDSYRFLRIAEREVEGRPLPDRDPQRWLPEGRNMREHLNLHATVMANAYRGARVLGYRAPFRSFALRYPPLVYALAAWALFVIGVRYVSPVAGLVAGSGLLFSPATAYRAAAGFTDRDPFCLLLIVGIYGAYCGVFLEHTVRRRLIAAAACGVTAALLGLAWEGVGLFTLPLAVTLAWQAMSGRLDRDGMRAHWLICLLAIVPLFVFTHAFRTVFQAFAAVAIFPLPIACAAAECTLRLRRHSTRLGGRPEYRSAILFALWVVVFSLLPIPVLAAFLPGAEQALPLLLGNTMNVLGQHRLALILTELADMTAADWWLQFGPALLLTGTGLVIVGRALLRDRRGQTLALIFLLCSVLIAASSPLFPASRLNERAPTAGLLRLGALALWFLSTVLLTARKDDDEERDGARPMGPPLVLLTAWWLVLLVASVGAVRYSYFLAPAAWMLAGIAVTAAFQRAGGVRLRDRRREVFGAAAAAALLAWSVGTNASTLREQVLAIRPMWVGYSGFLEAVGEVLPRDAVLFTWWDYGAYVNVFADRGTIIDEDHFRVPRIYEMARDAYVTERPETALRALRRYGATHWMITDEDISVLPEIAWLAVEPAPAPLMRQTIFDPTPETRPEGSAWSLPLPEPVEVWDRATLSGLGSQGKTFVAGVQIGMPDSEDGFPEVTVQTETEGRTEARKPRVLMWRGRTHVDPEGELPGRLLVRRFGNGQIGAVWYPEGMCRSLAFRLFILNEAIPGFQPVKGLQWPPQVESPTQYRARVWQVDERSLRITQPSP